MVEDDLESGRCANDGEVLGGCARRGVLCLDRCMVILLPFFCEESEKYN